MYVVLGAYDIDPTSHRDTSQKRVPIPGPGGVRIKEVGL